MVERYSFPPMTGGRVIKSNVGGWVRFTDYDKLLRLYEYEASLGTIQQGADERTRLRTENDQLRRERDSDQQSATDLEDSLLACENGQTIYDVLANYRAVRRTIQRAREVPSND